MNVASAESRYALLIANQNYPTPQKDLNIFGALETPVQEMREFAKVLRDYNFEVTEIANANSDDMSVAINQFTSKLQPGDVGLFYYAGHGVQVDGNNYLIPVQKKFADAVEVKNGAYLAQSAIDKLSRSNARVKLVFLDSCRNQLLIKEKGRGFSDPGFAKMDAEGVVISYATGLGKIAADNITYTSQLIKAIRDNESERIEIVLSEAQELTAQATGGQQIPWYEKGMVGKFCFGTCGKKSTSDDELARLREENARLRNTNILPPEVTPPQQGKSFRDKKIEQKVGDCSESRIIGKLTRLEGTPAGEAGGGEVVVLLENKIGLYILTVPSIKPSINQDKYMYSTSDFIKGDRVKLCLISIPEDCPPGDDRGKTYSVTNYKNKKIFTGVDSWHSCGGA